ncbi:hypothetical protein F4824DRAFT_470233 [Ustulina deusta]|nr:hypothetical protein F4824DRAFT_470233 [Ustulina deusta]
MTIFLRVTPYGSHPTRPSLYMDVLPGRSTWTKRDVEELRSGEVRKRIESDSKYLRLGVLASS